MCKIKIGDLLKDKSYPEAGDNLYKKILHYIDSEDKVVLDMSEVDALPSMFLNTSIGRFIDDFGYDKLKSKVSFSNIGSSQAERIKDYIVKIVASK